MTIELAPSRIVSTCADLVRILSTGAGDVHSQDDLVSRSHVKVGIENAEAYELAKQNYHRYLIDFLLWFVNHKKNLALVQDEAIAEAYDRDPMPDDLGEVYREVMEEQAPDRWRGNYPEDQILSNIMEKTAVAELKCRHIRSHPPRDLFGEWEQNETHLAEHVPALNNISTALRRGISQETLFDFRNELQLIMHPVECDDFVEGNSETYNNQVFADEVKQYNAQMMNLGWGGPTPPGPLKPGPGGRGIPYDILEFVPQFPTVNFDTRLDRLRMDYRTEVNRCEILCPRGQGPVLRGRDFDKYINNEHFVDRTLALIFEFLALDPGLSRVRMVETGKLFHSMIMEPWYFEYGNGERQAGEGGEGHEDANNWLRDAIIDLDNALAELPEYEQPGFIDDWWDKICYDQVLDPSALGSKTIEGVHSTALSRWRRFYSNWLQILANVELSHTKVTQEQLDEKGLTSCLVCGDDYDVNSPYNCAVYIQCENNHMLCKKCYTQLSLTPTKPYNDLNADRHCPECRAVLTYQNAVRNVTGGMQLMPSLSTDFPYTTVAE